MLELSPDRQNPRPGPSRCDYGVTGSDSVPGFPRHSWPGLRSIQERGWEDSKWRVYDYEMSGLDLFCSSIRFERRKGTEQIDPPNGGPAEPLANSGPGGGPPSVS